ncbi:MAG: carotenoid biosynthesis protein [Anaerolineaceae bacterium]|nr:carotenoid biosynthesis protein [Anaerolineaceae bacterium]
MKKPNSRGPFIYLVIITTLAVILIISNAMLGLPIPFTVDFLIAFIGALIIFVVWHAILTKGWKRTLVMLSLSYLIAFSAEALGVNFGLIFGKYHYTDVLGIQIFGVPLLAALAVCRRDKNFDNINSPTGQNGLLIATKQA